MKEGEEESDYAVRGLTPAKSRPFPTRAAASIKTTAAQSASSAVISLHQTIRSQRSLSLKTAAKLSLSACQGKTANTKRNQKSERGDMTDQRRPRKPAGCSFRILTWDDEWGGREGLARLGINCRSSQAPQIISTRYFWYRLSLETLAKIVL
eukprot:925814-Rhodomonas_salina.1